MSATKQFVITYEHITGPQEVTKNGWDELLQFLEILDNGEYVSNSTISINTIEP